MPKNSQDYSFPGKIVRPDFHLDLHAKRLEKSLLFTLEHKKNWFKSFSYFFHLLFSMSSRKKILATGFAAFVLLAVIASFNIPGFGFVSKIAQVNAQTILKKVSNEVAGLPTEKVLELDKALQVNLRDLLAQAKLAKDLKYCNKEDCKTLQNNTLSLAGKSLKDNTSLDLLEFTDEQGNTVFMAVKKDNIPDFVLKFHQDSPGESTLQFTPGEGYEDGANLELKVNASQVYEFINNSAASY